MVLTLIVEALFAAVFARVLVAYLRRRDPLQRDVAVMFSALAVLFVLELLRQVLGEPPQVVSSLASALLVGQPFLLLRLVRRVAPVPVPVYRLGLGGWAASAVLLMTVTSSKRRRSPVRVREAGVCTSASPKRSEFASAAAKPSRWVSIQSVYRLRTVN